MFVYPSKWRHLVAALALISIGAGTPLPATYGQSSESQSQSDSDSTAVADGLEEETKKAINKTDKVVFRGLKTVTEEDARDWIGHQLDYIEEHGVSTARADDAAYFLKAALQERGYDDADVSWDVPSNSRILLEVTEGGLLLLTAVRSEGNVAISDEGLFELMTSDTSERLGLEADDPIPYVIEDINEGRNHVKDFYELLGYIGAEVTLLEPQIESNSSGRRASVRLKIIEGKIYRVGKLNLGDPPELGLADELEQIRSDYQGEIYSPSLGAQIEARMRGAAIDAGYFEAEIEMTPNDPVDSGESVLVDLDVSRADYGRKFVVRQLKVKGNDRVKPLYFDRMFEDITGETYQPDATNEVVADMLRSGAFSRASAFPVVVDEEAGLLDLEIDIEEAKRQELSPFVGYGSYEGGIVGVEYRHLNMRGLVHRVDSLIEISQRGITGKLKYTDPSIFWSEWEASGGLFGQLRTNEGYTKLQQGLRAETKRELGHRDFLTFFLQGSYTDIFDEEIEQPFLGDENYIDSFAGLSYEIDHRDDILQPRSGFYFQASNSVGSSVIGSDYDYLRSTIKLSYHQPIGPTTLHLGARSGAIFGLGSGDDGSDVLPIDLRFFSGGAQSVRSFAERELGPRDPGNFPIGGEFYTTFNAEYEIPIVGPLSLAIFTDAGNLMYRYDDAGFDDMHYAGGLGLRLHSPLGPLRLDYGHNLNRGEDEPSGAFHVGFGAAF